MHSLEPLQYLPFSNQETDLCVYVCDRPFHQGFCSPYLSFLAKFPVLKRLLENSSRYILAIVVQLLNCQLQSNFCQSCPSGEQRTKTRNSSMAIGESLWASLDQVTLQEKGRNKRNGCVTAAPGGVQLEPTISL